MKEFNRILKERAPLIKKSLMEPVKVNVEQESDHKAKIEPKSK
jgi:hypothetical protein